MKHYYAQYDEFVESHKSNTPSYGFSNTKKAIAFTSREKRDAFVASMDMDLSCKAITRKEAFTMLESFPYGEKAIRLDAIDGDYWTVKEGM